jgi:hypothetical protein
LQEICGHAVENDGAPVRGALTNQPFSQIEALFNRGFAFRAIRGGKFKVGFLLAAAGY